MTIHRDGGSTSDWDIPFGEDEDTVNLFWQRAADFAAARLDASLCVHPACGLTRWNDRSLTCGDHDCKLWVGWMPDTLRAYLYEDLAQALPQLEQQQGPRAVELATVLGLVFITANLGIAVGLAVAAAVAPVLRGG